MTWKFYAPKPPAAPAQTLPANNAVLAADNFRPVFTWKASAIPAGATPVQHYHLQVSQNKTFDGLDLDEYTLDAPTTYTTPFDLTPNRVYYSAHPRLKSSGGRHLVERAQLQDPARGCRPGLDREPGYAPAHFPLA